MGEERIEDTVRGAASQLIQVAKLKLGPDRTAELNAALVERAEQLRRVERATTSRHPEQPARSPKRPTALSSKERWRYLDRIVERDQQLRAWAWVWSSADDRTAHVRPSEPDGAQEGAPLDGYAVGVKDVIDVAGMPTRAGSPLTSPEPSTRDAPVVARAREAGAAIIGKTQCTEWALNDPAPTVNPWDAGRTPGGSSAGSAVAVATGMCRATLDTQTAGDVLRPAAYNGVVGFKPTIGWAPVDGTQPVAPTIDTIGVTARVVDDVAAVAAAVADEPQRFARLPISSAPRIGMLRDGFYDEVEPTLATNIAALAARLGAAGAVVEKIPCPVDLSLLHAAHRVVTFAECATCHLARYQSQPDQYGQRARDLLDLGLVTPAPAYRRAQEIRRDLTGRLVELFDDVDVLLVPVAPGPAPSRDTTGDSRFQIPWTFAGLPTLSLPSGDAAGLPLAVQLVAPAEAEATLLSVGRWCEAIVSSRPRL